MLVRELVPSNTNNNQASQYFRSKSTLSSSKSEQSIQIGTPRESRRTFSGDFTNKESPRQSCSRITLNVSGTIFETLEGTLSEFPNTLLGDPKRRQQFYDPKFGIYRFFRDPESFDAILFYYQSKGILAKPLSIRRDVFESEMEFFGIKAHFDKRHRFEQNLLEEMSKTMPMPKQKLRKIVWSAFEDPHSSFAASIISVLSIAMILVSVISICAETLPGLKQEKTITRLNLTRGNETEIVRNVKYGYDHWFTVESICITWFTLEYVLRVLSAPSCCSFIFSALGLVDLVSITPFYVTLALQLRTAGRNVVNTLAIIRMMRLVRIVRVFKLTRYNEGLRILVMTIYESSVHLRSLFLVILIMAIFFATLVYYTEALGSGSSDTEFTSIPDTYWYSIITMTTVGYGDVYPKTTGGKFLGAFCGVFGVLLFCLPSPVLVNKFIECYYLRQTLSEDEGPERKAFVESMKEIYFKGT